ncbi:MAG: chloride transporter, partial [Burkholderiales bacterium PBB5]
MTDEPFALLDDGQASAASPSSRLYTGWAHSHVGHGPAELDALWTRVQTDQRAGLHAVLLADYAFGAALIGAAHRHGPTGAPLPALRVLMFRQLQRLGAAAVDAWLAARDDGQPAGPLGLVPSVTEAQFHAAIAAIHDAIAQGQTYQVNYTYRLNGAAYGHPLALYRRLRAHQPVPFGALIRLPAADRQDGPGVDAADATEWVLSRSPELLLRHARGLLTARPMKGTARRVAGQPEADSATAHALAHDVKNRAENLMIVDLLRNDLG